MKRRKLYPAQPTARELTHDEKARQAAKRATERERLAGISETDTAARWLARHDPDYRKRPA
jgi:hypothetical protein